MCIRLFISVVLFVLCIMISYWFLLSVLGFMVCRVNESCLVFCVIVVLVVIGLLFWGWGSMVRLVGLVFVWCCSVLWCSYSIIFGGRWFCLKCLLLKYLVIREWVSVVC